jgi:hypothetical protein
MILTLCCRTFRKCQYQPAVAGGAGTASSDGHRGRLRPGMGLLCPGTSSGQTVNLIGIHGAWRRRSRVSLIYWGIEHVDNLSRNTPAGSVAIYGVPKGHIANTDYLSDACIRVDSGPCQVVDVRRAYLNSEHHHESVLLWRHDALDSSRSTHLSIRLVKAASEDTSVFPFKAIHYFEPQEYAR